MKGTETRKPRQWMAAAMAAVMLPACACGGGTGSSPESGSLSGSSSAAEELPLTPDYGIGDQSNLYGMCYLLEERTYWGSPFTDDDIATDIALINNLGCRTVRHWMHCVTLMSDPETIDEEACALMHKALEECERYGIVNIGMNHHNFNGGVSSVGKLRRNMTKGSEYIAWLEDYYTTWYTLVSEFPEVQYWEIDNELNNPDFMYDAYDRSFFTPEEMAAISTDMLYYATRAIHDANPEAQSVMGGLTEPLSLGNSDFEGGRPSNVWFLQVIYDNIAGGEFGYFYGEESAEDASLDPDDYFDVLSWHPYVWDRELDEDYFVEENNKVYQVALDNEGKHKKVFITEVGFTDFTRGEGVVTESIVKMFHAISTRMPYVETVNLFKMYDTATNSWAGSAEDNGYSRYGFFYDPDPGRTYYRLDEEKPTETTEELCIPGAPKKQAYALQELAGGKGPLTLWGGEN